MSTLVKLKQDLKFTQDLGDIIDVLKSAALIQFRLFQSREKPGLDFTKEIEACFDLLIKTGINHPYFSVRENLPSAILVITSDEGFLGELNILLINHCLDQRKTQDDRLIVLGERGVRYLEDAEEKFVSFPGLSNAVDYKEVENIRDYLLKGYYQDKFGRVLVVYPEFVSLTHQKVATLQLLPYQNPREEILSSKKKGAPKDLLIEPNLSRVLAGLFKLAVGAKLLEIFWSTKQSEFAARIMHLEGSTEELAHLRRRFAFDYFRQIHALNDKTIREISASKVLLHKTRM